MGGGTGKAPEYSHLGSADGAPYLLQNGSGKRYRFHLRFATVDARSETAAREIQSDFRRNRKK